MRTLSIDDLAEMLDEERDRNAKLEEINRKLRWDRDDAEEEASHRRAQICQIAQALGVDHMVALPEDGSEWPLPERVIARARSLHMGDVASRARLARVHYAKVGNEE